jgi:hypothetical protein
LDFPARKPAPFKLLPEQIVPAAKDVAKPNLLVDRPKILPQAIILTEAMW